eukprot:TRINITY_DN5001_c0_g1_i1.p1 TRINITY_DN5001_c0_g1~~TRINITY_DN5001_c0_g1_i1.p1  ORF type:complete len:109 (+),score=12.93 TRINITY_DN5001_c0_g1_i1:73-399(+)
MCIRDRQDDTKPNAASDIWSFGMLIYFVLFKINPYERSKLKEEKQDDVASEADLDSAMIDIAKKCLKVDPFSRPTIHKLYDDLTSTCAKVISICRTVLTLLYIPSLFF